MIFPPTSGLTVTGKTTVAELCLVGADAHWPVRS